MATKSLYCGLRKVFIMKVAFFFMSTKVTFQLLNRGHMSYFMNWAPLYARKYIANTPTCKLTQNYHIEAKYAGFRVAVVVDIKIRNEIYKIDQQYNHYLAGGGGGAGLLLCWCPVCCVGNLEEWIKWGNWWGNCNGGLGGTTNAAGLSGWPPPDPGGFFEGGDLKKHRHDQYEIVPVNYVVNRGIRGLKTLKL